MGEFIEHPRLAQRVGALHQMLVEHPELAGVEAIEVANRRDLAIGLVLGDGTPRYLPLSINYLTLASIFRARSTLHGVVFAIWIWARGQATMIRLRSRVREERPSWRSSLASERRASGA